MGCPDENEILALLHGQRPGGDLERFEAHLDGCSACRAVVAALARSGQLPDVGSQSDLADSLIEKRTEAAPSAPGYGAKLERYLVLNRIGEGGMGQVFAAYDPDLDRKIALKLVRPEADGEAARARLLREAQTMARLSHPNVIPVYDVGTHGDDVFVAMELVDGLTLEAWTQVRPRGWREILRTYASAGRGLAAAHQAGLVHRDFKPDNVLVGNDGRVRVTDFGLARATAGRDEQDRPQADLPVEPKEPPGLTRSGAVLGTPAFMAPEQYRGEPADARTDQFSFCVALFRALYQEAPFAGANYASLRAAVLAGQVKEPERTAGVPGWVRVVVLRGLATDHLQRWPSMDELLRELLRDPARGRKRMGVAAGLVLVVGLAVFGLLQWNQRRAQLCTGAGQEIAQVWNPERKAAIRAAFTASNSPLAADAFDRVVRALDDYRASWIAVHTEACQATRIRGERSVDLLDRQVVCLQRRLVEVGTLVDLFAKADPKLVQQAAKAARVISSPQGCADLDSLASRIPPPVDPAARTEVEACAKALSEARALMTAGRVEQALEKTRKATDRARAVGYDPVLAEALLMQGQYEEAGGDLKTAEAALTEALQKAEETGEVRVAARAWTELTWVVGYRQGHYPEGLVFAGHARALLKQIGDPDLPLAYLHNHLGGIYWKQHKLEEALAAHNKALQGRERALGPDHPDVGVSLGNLGIVCRSLGRRQDAQRYYERAMQVIAKSVGERHPDRARILGNLGNLFFDDRDYKQAAARYREAIQIREQVLGENHPSVARTLTNLGYALYLMGEREESLAVQRRALAVAEAAHGPDHPEVAYSLDGLASSLGELGRRDEALEAYQRALAILEARFGREHKETAQVIHNLGSQHMQAGELDRAQELIEEALRVRTKLMGADSKEVVSSLLNLGVVAYRREHNAQAQGWFERARDVAVKAYGADHPKVIGALAWIARTHERQGLLANLQRVAAEALTKARTHPDDSILVDALAVSGLAHLAHKDPEAAQALLIEALALGERQRLLPLELAEARFCLARALPDSERARAQELAEAARAAYAATGFDQRPALLRIQAWQRGNASPASANRSPRPSP